MGPTSMKRRHPRTRTTELRTGYRVAQGRTNAALTNTSNRECANYERCVVGNLLEHTPTRGAICPIRTCPGLPEHLCGPYGWNR